MTVRALIKRWPVITYFAITVGISWTGILLIIVVGPGGFPATPEQVETLMPFVVLSMLAGPSVAGLLLTGLVNGRAGFRELLSRLLRWRVGARWYAVALLIAPLSAMASLLALSIFFPGFTPNIVTSENAATILLFGIVGGLSAGIFEELGWTGFATPELRRQYSILATGLIVGVMWGGWHVFAYYWGSGTPAGTLNRGLFLPGVLHSLAVLTAFRVLIVWMYDRTGSLLLAILMHASLSTSNLLFNPQPGIRLMVFHLGLAAVLWVVVGVVYVAGGWKLRMKTS
jgi:uncharacterized protein